MGQTRPSQHCQPWRARKGRWTGSRTGTGASPSGGGVPSSEPATHRRGSWTGGPSGAGAAAGPGSWDDRVFLPCAGSTELRAQSKSAPAHAGASVRWLQAQATRRPLEQTALVELVPEGEGLATLKPPTPPRGGGEHRRPGWEAGTGPARSPGEQPGPAGRSGLRALGQHRSSGRRGREATLEAVNGGGRGRQALSQSLFAGSASCGGRRERPVHTLRFSVPPPA